jgi:hypothetical protein
LIYSGVVAVSGARKTPTLNIPKSSLVRLQSVEDARYEQALQIYEAELQALKESKSKGNDELPQKPKPPREFYLDNATVESVDKVKGQQPDHGVTLIKDELSGLFASHGAYKGGTVAGSRKIDRETVPALVYRVTPYLSLEESNPINFAHY